MVIGAQGVAFQTPIRKMIQYDMQNTNVDLSHIRYSHDSPLRKQDIWASHSFLTPDGAHGEFSV